MGDSIKIDQYSRISSHSVELNFGSLSIGDSDAANVVVGERSIDFFYKPDDFPVYLDGHRINMLVSYTDDHEKMTIQRLQRTGNIAISDEVAESASIDVMNMTKYQQTVAFLYLLGKVMPHGG